MSFRDLFRRGVMTNVALHARLERKHAESTRDVKRDLKRAGFRKELIVANVRRLEKLVRRLDWKAGRTEWSDYGATTSYTDDDAVGRRRSSARSCTRGAGISPGTSAATRAATPASRPRTPGTWSQSTATRPSRIGFTERSPTRTRRRSCRSSAT